MSVIVELSLPADAFELGRIFAAGSDVDVALETLVPLGRRPVPFFKLHSEQTEAFERSIGGHPSVADLTRVDDGGDEALYALDRDIEQDRFFAALLATDAHLLEARGDAETWAFELRFDAHDDLSEFKRRCVDAGLPIEVECVYKPTDVDAGEWYGLTNPQREALVSAVESGYYAIPRRTSTKELAERLDISDQAVTERLRRSIQTLATNTVLLSADDDDG